MTTPNRFDGFPPESIKFFLELQQNNNRQWFQQYKQEFDTYVLTPARFFVEALAEILQPIAPRLHADPRVDQSIFRIYRDTRFSQDKTPYKTHLGIWLWEGSLPKMECSGFYFQLDPPNLMLAVGMYKFTDVTIKVFRDAIVDPNTGPALADAIRTVTQNEQYRIGGKHYKRVPRGYDIAHPMADLLLYRGLHATYETTIPVEISSPKIIEYCYNNYLHMLPIHRWLVDVVDAGNAS